MKNFKNKITTSLMICGFAFTLFISCSDSQLNATEGVSADSSKLFAPLTDEDTLKMERPLVDSLNKNI